MPYYLKLNNPAKAAPKMPTDVSKIDVDTLELIHRGEKHQDGYIRLCRKINNGEGFQNLAGIPSSQIRDYLPELVPYLLEDSYYSVNSFYKTERWKNSVTGLDHPLGKESDLRYLNACYADIDFYKSETPLTWPQASMLVAELQDENIIPTASIIGRSGRGMYLLWLLQNGRGGTLQRAFKQEIQLYKKIHKQIQKKINAYDPRLQCDSISDASRVLRIGGSVNSKSDSPVLYQIQVTARGVPVYSLHELSEHFKIKDCSYIKGSQGQDYYETMFEDGRRIKDRGSCPKRRRGKVATAKYRLDDLSIVEQNQNGFKKGSRRKSIEYFCRFAKQAEWTHPEILKEAKKIGKRCRPPYPSDTSDTPIQRIVDDVVFNRNSNFSGDTLARFFGVTDRFAEKNELRSIIPAETRLRRERAPSERDQARDDRLKGIKEILRAHLAKVPSTREMVRLLSAKGVETNRQTVSKEIPVVLDQVRIELKKSRK